MPKTNASDWLSGLKARNNLRDDQARVMGLQTKAKVRRDNENRHLVMVVTTDDVDLEDEVVLPAGADWTYVLGDKEAGQPGNRKLFVDHQHAIPSVVGGIRHIKRWPDGGSIRGWKMSARIMDSPLGDDVLRIIEETGTIGASIGFVPDEVDSPTSEERARYKAQSGREPRSIVRRWRGIEISLTAMPMNVTAQGSVLVAGGDKSAEAVLELCTKGVVGRDTARLLGCEVSEPPQKRVVIVV